MFREARLSAGLLKHFSSGINTPSGVKRDQHHALRDVILLVVCAVANGADGSEMIEELGREKLDWFGDFASFANNVHSQDCIAQAV